jgi:hypothetical protein
MLEVTLPMSVSLKWVTYACRMAGATRPRWSREHATWTTTARGPNGELETITLRSPAPTSVILDSDGDTAHRIVTSLFTGMRWAVRQRAA